MRAATLAWIFLAAAGAALAQPTVARDGTWTPPEPAPGHRWFRVLHTNDLHGHVFPRRYAGENLPAEFLGRPIGGLFSVASYLSQLRQRRFREDLGALRSYLRGGRDPFLFLDAGDWTGGALYDAETHGTSTARVLADRALDLDATVVGNHAWDYYKAGLERFLAVLDGRVPVLGANLRETGQPVPWARPSVVFEVDHVRVGVLGVLTEHAMSAALPEKTAGFSTSSILQSLQEQIEDLAARADVVILLGHVGIERDAELAAGFEAWLRGPGAGKVHLFVDGHSHRDRQDTLAGVPVVQADHFGTRLGEVFLELDPRLRPTGQFYARRIVLDEALWPAPPAMLRRFDADLLARRALEAQVVAATEADLVVPALPRADPRVNSPVGDLIASAFVAAARELPGMADVAVGVMNQGGVRMGLYAEGEAITRAALHGVLPFSNMLAVLDVSGETLVRLVTTGIQSRSRLSFHGLQIDVEEGPAEPGVAPHRELLALAVVGAGGTTTPVRQGGRYRLVTNEYLADQGFRDSPVEARTDLALTDYQAVATALAAWETADGPLRAVAVARRAPPSVRGAE